MQLLNEILEKYLDYDYGELVRHAKRDMELLLPVFDTLAFDKNGKPYVMIFMCTALASDGKFSDAEFEFVNDLMGFDREYAEKLIEKHKDVRAIELSDRVFDLCNESIKAVLTDFCLCFLAVDDEINDKERDFIARLLA